MRGKSRVISSTEQIQLESGDCLLMKCGNFVNHWINEGKEEEYEVIAFQFFPEILQWAYDSQLPSALKTSVINKHQPFLKLTSNKIIDYFFEGILIYMRENGMITDEFLKIKVRELIHLLIHLKDPKVEQFLVQLFQTKTYQFQEVINANLYENLKIEDYAFLLGMSLSTFQRKFKSIYNQSPKKYIIGKRLEKAQKLLLETSLRVSDIAYDCGFEDIAHFSKSFSLIYKKSPREYRNSH